MHSSTRSRRLVAGVAVVAALLSACSSDSKSTATTAGPATAAAAPTTVATTTAQTTATTSAGTDTTVATSSSTANTSSSTATSGSTPGTSSGTSASAADPLGKPTAASGTPVKIGLITESGGDAIGSQSALTEQGAKMAVSYVNGYRNGLAGHPIDLFICGNKASPTGASDCANQMVEQHVAAVIWPFTGFGPQEVPIITGAGIPIIAVSGSSTEELTTPNVFVLTGGYPGTLGAYAKYAKDKGVKKFAMIVIDVPSATGAAQQLGGIVFKNAGVDYSVVPVPPGTPDLTSQIQAAVSGGADAIGVTGDVTFCTSFFQAYQTLALKIPKYIIAPCIDPTVVSSLGDVLAGSILATVNGKGPDDATYSAIVAKYGDGSINADPNVSAGVASGVATVMDLSNLFAGYTGDVTAATAITQTKTAKAVPIWGSGGLTFTCDGKAVSILPNVCSSSFQIGTVDAKGAISGLTPVDASALYAVG